MSDKVATIKRPADILDMSRYRAGGEKVTPEYEHYVQLTAKLIKRSYIATAKLVESWPTEKIIRRYEECTKHAGTMPGDVKWWWLRKNDKKT